MKVDIRFPKNTGFMANDLRDTLQQILAEAGFDAKVKVWNAAINWSGEWHHIHSE